MKEADFTDINYGLDLSKDGDFVLGATRFDHSTRYESDIYYVHDGKVMHYLAVGDDKLDVERDWAFEYASIYPDQTPVDNPKPTFFQSIKSALGLA